MGAYTKWGFAIACGAFGNYGYVQGGWVAWSFLPLAAVFGAIALPRQFWN